eukprot:gnl/TRDRNA2_/TRDRNA2_136206_c0_seq1.p1 gnl/TRDRNA2_/TRDRNA2_136206_c0~~gnl/TRDRNA2_/TRDRNA2_136206_c0_seq1.p1  ORF type:complete len:615 (-),score=138.89 gnl/TRDRNA2_/TRDRNA2_136206_c0_seq1:65-1909(-)
MSADRHQGAAHKGAQEQDDAEVQEILAAEAYVEALYEEAKDLVSKNASKCEEQAKQKSSREQWRSWSKLVASDPAETRPVAESRYAPRRRRSAAEQDAAEIEEAEQSMAALYQEAAQLVAQSSPASSPVLQDKSFDEWQKSSERMRAEAERAAAEEADAKSMIKDKIAAAARKREAQKNSPEKNMAAVQLAELEAALSKAAADERAAKQAVEDRLSATEREAALRLRASAEKVRADLAALEKALITKRNSFSPTLAEKNPWLEETDPLEAAADADPELGVKKFLDFSDDSVEPVTPRSVKEPTGSSPTPPDPTRCSESNGSPGHSNGSIGARVVRRPVTREAKYPTDQGDKGSSFFESIANFFTPSDHTNRHTKNDSEATLRGTHNGTSMPQVADANKDRAQVINETPTGAKLEEIRESREMNMPSDHDLGLGPDDQLGPTMSNMSGHLQRRELHSKEWLDSTVLLQDATLAVYKPEGGRSADPRSGGRVLAFEYELSPAYEVVRTADREWILRKLDGARPPLEFQSPTETEADAWVQRLQGLCGIKHVWKQRGETVSASMALSDASREFRKTTPRSARSQRGETPSASMALNDALRERRNANKSLANKSPRTR